MIEATPNTEMNHTDMGTAAQKSENEGQEPMTPEAIIAELRATIDSLTAQVEENQKLIKVLMEQLVRLAEKGNATDEKVAKLTESLAAVENSRAN